MNTDLLKSTEKWETTFWKPYLSRLFDNNNFVKLGAMDQFDFYNEDIKLYVEVKDIGFSKTHFDTQILGWNKIEKGKTYLDTGYLVCFLVRYNCGSVQSLFLSTDKIDKFKVKYIRNGRSGYLKKHASISKDLWEDVEEDEQYLFF